jgi:hypothetical protein
VIKTASRGQIEQTQKRLFATRSNLLLAVVDKEIVKAKEAATAAYAAGTKTVVLDINVGSDAKAIKRTVDELKKV